MYYENFEKLCKMNDVKPGTVSKATGIPTSTLTNWKQGNYTPKQDKLQLIADYFDTTVDFIMTGKQPELAIEMADRDTELLFMQKRLKEYAIRLSKLPQEKQDLIMKMIDNLEE